MNSICKLSGIKLNIHKLSILSPSIHRINTRGNNTLNPEGVEILEVEEKDEYLFVEEAKLYVIIMGNQDVFPRTV